MPQPLTYHQREGTHWNSLTLMDRPECALGVARVASAWAFLEFLLIQMFWSATGDFEPDDNTGELSLVGHPLAVSSLSALESVSAKLDVIAAGIAGYLPTMTPGFDQLRAGVRTCARERNKIVHAIWGSNDRYPNDVICVETFTDDFIKYTPADFGNTVDRILAQIERVSEFDQACREARQAELPTHQN